MYFLLIALGLCKICSCTSLPLSMSHEVGRESSHGTKELLTYHQFSRLGISVALHFAGLYTCIGVPEWALGWV